MNIQNVTFNNISFVNVHTPHDLEIKYLKNEFNFNPLILEDYLNQSQIPQIEEYNDYTLLVMDFPFFGELANNTQKQSSSISSLSSKIHLPHFHNPPKKKRIRFGHINFFIGKNYLVVLHDERTPQVDEIFAKCQKTLKDRQVFMDEGPVYLFYKIADVLVDSCFPVINELSTTIDQIDTQLAERTSAHLIEDISVTRRNLVVFQTMIKPLLPLFNDLERGRYKALNGEMNPYWSNILDHLQKIWDRLEDNRELNEGIARSHESLLSVRTNETIKILTIFTALLLPLTLLASIYGMNITLPFGDDPWAFLYIIEIMVIIAVSMFAIFKFRDWV